MFQAVAMLVSTILNAILDPIFILPTLLAFIIVYSVLGLLDIFLLRKYAIKGPQGQED